MNAVALTVDAGHPPAMEKMLDDFMRAMALRQRRSPGTVKAYFWGCSRLVRWLEERDVDDLTAVTPPLVREWQDSLAEEGLAPRSQSMATTAVRAWWRYLARSGIRVDLLATDSLERIRAPRLQPRPLRGEDLDRLIAFLRPYPGCGIIHLRNRALFLYLVATSARVSEILQLTRSEFEAEVTVRQKGGSQKVLMAAPVAVDAVLAYLRARKDNHPSLWVTHDNNRPIRELDPSAVREIWYRLSLKLGVPRFTTHQLRHTCATELFDAGVDPAVVAEHLGHHGMATIRVYMDVSRRRRLEAVEAMELRLTGARPEPARPYLLPKLARRGGRSGGDGDIRGPGRR